MNIWIILLINCQKGLALTLTKKCLFYYHKRAKKYCKCSQLGAFKAENLSYFCLKCMLLFFDDLRLSLDCTNNHKALHFLSWYRSNNMMREWLFDSSSAKLPSIKCTDIMKKCFFKGSNCVHMKTSMTEFIGREREKGEKKRAVLLFHRGGDSRWRFTSAVLMSDRSSFKRFMSSFLICLGDCPTSCLT